MSKKILIVDDSPTMLQSIKLTLGKEGFAVTTATDGMDALRQINNGDKFNAVITDVNMPNMNGIELTREIRKMSALKFTPVIILTTESQAQKKEEGKSAGATGWMVKPFKPEELVHVIRRVCP